MIKIKAENMFKVIKLAEGMKERHPDWRQGQCFFNALYSLERDCAESIRGGKDDPFYKDDMIEVLNLSIELTDWEPYGIKN